MYSGETLRRKTQNAMGIGAFAKVRSLWHDFLPPCSNPSCPQKPLARAMARRNTGIAVAEKWICGPDCFEEVARDRLSAIMSSRHAQESAPKLRMPLGLVMVSRGDLTAEQLRSVLDEQQRTGENVGNIAQQLGFATQDQITAAVAAQWSCGVFPLRDRALSPAVHVPRRLLETYKMLPVHYVETGRSLMVGFVTRVQYHILRTIEHITSCVATPCFITAREYNQYLHSAAFGERENEIVFDRVSGTGEMAKLARNYVNQISAHKARFGICRDYLWMRIWGNQNEMDLLFRLQPE
jgi:hypothetical protein